MMPAHKTECLIERLPAVRGEIRADVPLARITWFRVGGSAEILFRPADRDDLMDFLANRPDDVEVTVIGVASNLLVRDGGIPGVTVRLGRSFATVEVDDTRVDAGAAALDINVARACRDAGVSGLEFLSGIPGTIGGALSMNAGAFGREMKDVTVACEALDADGRIHTLGLDDLGFSYRHCAVPKDWIFVGVRLQGDTGVRDDIARRMDHIAGARQESQPIRSRTGGSTFTNPPGAKAWTLIEAAGCRGLRHGGAMVSEQHCNFLINTGSATAGDLEALGEEVRRRVQETSGVTLEWEIRRIGISAAETADQAAGRNMVENNNRNGS